MATTPASSRRATRQWPAWARRGRMELVACAIIGTGILMLLQPFFMALFTWSFATMLAGTVMFMVVSKFPASDG